MSAFLPFRSHFHGQCMTEEAWSELFFWRNCLFHSFSFLPREIFIDEVKFGSRVKFESGFVFSVLFFLLLRFCLYQRL